VSVLNRRFETPERLIAREDFIER